MPETQETLLTLAEAAKLARCSKPHMWRLVQNGEVPALRVGEGHGPIRIRREAFERWLYGEESEEQQ